MKIKIVGIVLIYLSFFTAGSYIKRTYIKRAEYLRMLLCVTSCAKTRLRNAPLNLSELLRYAAQDSQDELSSFFYEVSLRLDTENTPLSQIWRSEAKVHMIFEAADKKTENFINMFFSALNEPMRETVINHLALLEEDLKTAHEYAQRLTAEKGEVYSKLIRLSGILFAVMFI